MAGKSNSIWRSVEDKNNRPEEDTLVLVLIAVYDKKADNWYFVTDTASIVTEETPYGNHFLPTGDWFHGEPCVVVKWKPMPPPPAGVTKEDCDRIWKKAKRKMEEQQANKKNSKINAKDIKKDIDDNIRDCKIVSKNL